MFGGGGGTATDRVYYGKSVFNIVFKKKLYDGVEANLAVFLTLALDTFFVVEPFHRW
jgi:hypothetical protein